MNVIKITTEYITLGQCLKLIHVVSSGGESKHYLASYVVLVNGERETRRGRKLIEGSLVTVNQMSYEVQRET
jgi:ribosome-associated protein